MRSMVLIFAMTFGALSPLRAQILDEYLGHCFGGQQLPCTQYIVFDAVFAKQLGGSIRNHQGEDERGNIIPDNKGTYAGLEVGGMWNRGRHTSLGGTVEYGVDDQFQGRLAVKARARRWLSEHAAADVSLGVVSETVFKPGWVYDECGTCTEPGYGLTADATFGHRLLGITIGGDVIHAYGQQMTSFRAGARAGGILGLGITAAIVALVGSAAASL